MTDFFRRTGLLPGTAFVVASDAPAAMIRQALILKARYGALIQICDGVDDNVEIQAAIGALPISGGKVQLSEGTFPISSTINLASNTWLNGTPATTIIGSGGTLYRLITNTHWGGGDTNIMVTNLTLDGTFVAGNISQGGLAYFTNMTILYCSKLRITRGYTHNLELCKVIGALIDNCEGWGSAGDDQFSVSDGSYSPNGTIAAAISKYIIFIDCVAHGNNGLSNSSGFEVDDGPSYIIFNNCTSYGNTSGCGFNVHCHTGATSPHHIKYINCVSYSNLKNFYSVGTADISGNYIGYVEIRGCTSFSPVADNIHCVKTDNLSIVNNTISGEWGIFILPSATGVQSKVVLVNGNIIFGDSTKNENGIDIQEVLGCIVSNNIVQNCGGTGINVHSATIAISNISIINNVCKNNGQFVAGLAGIRISSQDTGDSVSNIIIIGNQCYDDQTPKTQEYGLTLRSQPAGASNLTNIFISGNNFLNNKTGAVRIQDNALVSNSIWSNNTGYISHGEVRTASGSLVAGLANAIAFAWHNPELQDILIKKVVIEVTTPGGTALSVLQVGIANDAMGTGLGTEFFPVAGLDLNSAAVRDSWNATDTGVQIKWVFCDDSASATKGWIVGKILIQDASSLVGKYYIEYAGR